MKKTVSVLFFSIAVSVLAFDEPPNYSQWVVYNVRDFGAKGDGITNDRAAFNKVLAQAGVGRVVVYVPTGNYLLTTSSGEALPPLPNPQNSVGPLLTIPNSQIVIRGDGVRESRIISDKTTAIFGGYGLTDESRSDLTLIDLGFEITAGYTTGVRTYGLAFGGVTLRTYNVEFRNIYSGIYIPEGAPVQLLSINNSRFVYEHGRASVSNPGDSDPHVAVLNGAFHTHLFNCFFDGLVDPAFSNVKGNPPGQEFLPVDGLLKTNGWAEDVVVQGCTIRDNGVEGVLVDSEAAPRFSNVTVTISENVFEGADPNFMVASLQPPKPGQIQTGWDGPGSYNPAMSLQNVAGSVLRNSIRNGIPGINVNGPTSGSSLALTDNVIHDCIQGIHAENVGSLSINGNAIHFSRKLTDAERSDPTKAGLLCGLFINDCPNVNLLNNTIDAGDSDWWQGEVTLAADAPVGATVLQIQPFVVPSPANGYLCFVGYSATSSIENSLSFASTTEVQLHWQPLPMPLPAGSIVKYTPADLTQHSALLLWASQVQNGLPPTFVTSQNNVFTGALLPVVVKDSSSSLSSTHDTFVGYPAPVVYQLQHTNGVNLQSPSFQ